MKTRFELTLTEHYTEWLALLLDQLISVNWRDEHVEVARKQRVMRRCEEGMHDQPEALQDVRLQMIEAIDLQLALTLPATQRMTSYRTEAQRNDYARMLHFRTTLINERERLSDLVDLTLEFLPQAA